MKGTVINIKKNVITVVYKNDIQLSLKDIKTPVSVGREIIFSEENVISGYMEKWKFRIKSFLCGSLILLHSFSEENIISHSMKKWMFRIKSLFCRHSIPLQRKNKCKDEIFAEFILEGSSYFKFAMNSKGDICNIKPLNKKSESKYRLLRVLEGQSLYNAIMCLIVKAKNDGIKVNTRKAALTLITHKDDDSIILFEKRIMKIIKDINEKSNVQAVFFKFRKEEHTATDISLVRYWMWKNILNKESVEYIKEASFTELACQFEDFERIPGFKSVV